MLVTESKPIGEILTSLKGKKNIFLFGCGECSTTCKTGGEPEVLKMKEDLEKEGKHVTGWVVPKAPCIAPQVLAAFAKNRKKIEDADAILVLACGSGVQCVRETGRPKKPTYTASNTMFGSIMDKSGAFVEKCTNCGECVLSGTGAICPVSLCPKGLLNGPCGGCVEGKCEVDRNRDCVWALIYKDMKETGVFNYLQEYQPPKDYSKQRKPHKLILQSK